MNSSTASTLNSFKCFFKTLAAAKCPTADYNSIIILREFPYRIIILGCYYNFISISTPAGKSNLINESTVLGVGLAMSINLL